MSMSDARDLVVAEERIEGQRLHPQPRKAAALRTSSISLARERKPASTLRNGSAVVSRPSL